MGKGKRGADAVAKKEYNSLVKGMLGSTLVLKD